MTNIAFDEHNPIIEEFRKQIIKNNLYTTIIDYMNEHNIISYNVIYESNDVNDSAKEFIESLSRIIGYKNGRI